MNFNKMKLDKTGKSNIAGDMSELMVTIIIVAVFSVIVISVILIFAPLVQEKAATAQATAETANNSAVAGLWSILATEGLFEILAVSVYILLVVVILISLVIKATKKMN